MDGAWIRSIFSAALVPDAAFYLRLSVEELIPRVVFSRGFAYWESGMDVFPGQDGKRKTARHSARDDR